MLILIIIIAPTLWLIGMANLVDRTLVASLNVVLLELERPP
jgi:hypothetical protein